MSRKWAVDREAPDGPMADKLRALGFTNRQAEAARASMLHETAKDARATIIRGKEA
jgi:hypothetical protein